MLGPTTWSIVKERRAEGSIYRLNKDSHNPVGLWCASKQIQASITCQTSAIAVETADEKDPKVKTYLKRAGIPVSQGRWYLPRKSTLGFENLGTAVVVKPDVESRQWVTINVTDPEQLKMAFPCGVCLPPEVIVERRICPKAATSVFLVINGRIYCCDKENHGPCLGMEYHHPWLIQIVNSDPFARFWT